MANNYCQWSELIEELTDEEMNWFHSCLTWEPPYNDDHELPAGFVFPFWYDPDAGGVNFDYDLKRKERTLHVYAEEDGNLDTLSALVQEFIKKFRPDFIFCVSWADTCSKMRVGVFGGGAMVVSREGEKHITTSSFIRNTVAKIKEER